MLFSVLQVYVHISELVCLCYKLGINSFQVKYFFITRSASQQKCLIIFLIVLYKVMTRVLTLFYLILAVLDCNTHQLTRGFYLMFLVINKVTEEAE